MSKSESHGCVRLTNWDAKNLAAMVDKGTPVDFLDTATNALAAVPEEGSGRRRAHRRR